MRQPGELHGEEITRIGGTSYKPSIAVSQIRPDLASGCLSGRNRIFIKSGLREANIKGTTMTPTPLQKV